MEGRQILDVVLIENEAVDSMLKDKDCGLLCKLNIEMAYFLINWDFLLVVKGKWVLGKNG